MDQIALSMYRNKKDLVWACRCFIDGSPPLAIPSWPSLRMLYSIPQILKKYSSIKKECGCKSICPYMHQESRGREEGRKKQKPCVILTYPLSKNCHHAMLSCYVIYEILWMIFHRKCLNVHTVCTNFGLIVHSPFDKIEIRKCMCTFCLCWLGIITSQTVSRVTQSHSDTLKTPSRRR